MIDILDVYESEILRQEFDLIIFSSGFEKRARHFFTKYKKDIVLKPNAIKLCLSFNDFTDLFDRKRNDFCFEQSGFKFLNVDDFRYGSLAKFIEAQLSQHEYSQNKLTVLIDYTVMRRYWYSEIIQYFHLLSEQGIKIDVYFVYSAGSYMGKKKHKIVDDYVLIPGFEGVGSQTKDKFGIYSLGFEPYTIISVQEWVEPSRICCIVADPGSKKGSFKECMRINKNFLATNNHELLTTPIYSIKDYCNLVLDIVKKESLKYDIVVF